MPIHQLFMFSRFCINIPYFLVFSQFLSLFCPSLKNNYYLWKPNETNLKRGFQLWQQEKEQKRTT